jgi:hypothetical protein
LTRDIVPSDYNFTKLIGTLKRKGWDVNAPIFVSGRHLSVSIAEEVVPVYHLLLVMNPNYRHLELFSALIEHGARLSTSQVTVPRCIPIPQGLERQNQFAVVSLPCCVRVCAGLHIEAVDPGASFPCTPLHGRRGVSAA